MVEEEGISILEGRIITTKDLVEGTASGKKLVYSMRKRKNELELGFNYANQNGIKVHNNNLLGLGFISSFSPNTSLEQSFHI